MGEFFTRLWEMLLGWIGGFVSGLIDTFGPVVAKGLGLLFLAWVGYQVFESVLDGGGSGKSQKKKKKE